MIADKGYDSQGFIQHISDSGMVAVIPPRSNRKQPRSYDDHLYRERHLVECFIGKMKHYRQDILPVRQTGQQIPRIPTIRCCSHLVAVKCQHYLAVSVWSSPFQPRCTQIIRARQPRLPS